MHVPVRELKSRLSEYLRRAAAGEEVIVTSRGKPIARLSAPRSGGRGRPSPEDEAIALLRSQRWVRPGKGKLGLPKYVVRLEPHEKPLAEIVADERG